MSATATGHASSTTASVPPSGAALLAAFIGSLADPANAARALYTLCGSLAPTHLDRDGTLPNLLPFITVRVAPKANHSWQGNHYAMAAVFSDPFKIELHLPPFFGSVTGVTAFLQADGMQFSDYIYRTREIAFLLCELLYIGRIRLMADLQRKFGTLPASLCFRFAPGDGCPEPDVVTLSRNFGANNLLIPDGYYYKHNGYIQHEERVSTDRTPWSDRSDIALWRGTTTGAPFTSKDVMTNERIRLTAICAERPDLFDAKISLIAQVAEADRGAVERVLASHGLLGSMVRMDTFRHHKYALHIDGNTSAAGLFEKMALGCCVLRVASRFEQWIEPRIRPWEHFVPIAADMSNLVSVMTMLISNPDLGERIAKNAFAFATEADYVHEAHVFCRSLCDASDVAPRSIKLEQGPADAVVPLAAPGKASLADAYWNGPEMENGVAFRWTKAERIVWTVPATVAKPGRCRFTVPYHGEIRPGFTSACSLEIAGQTYPLKLEGGMLTAKVVLDKDFDGTVALVTPRPLSTAELGTGSDTRTLGIAIVVG